MKLLPLLSAAVALLAQIGISSAQVQGCAEGQIGVCVDSTVDFTFSEIFTATCNPITVEDSNGSASPCAGTWSHGSTVACNSSNQVTAVTTLDGESWTCSPISDILAGICGNAFFGVHVQYCCSPV